MRLAVTLANDPPGTLSELARLLDHADLQLSQPATAGDLSEIQAFMDRWLAVVDATEETGRAAELNDLLAGYAADPRLTDHRGMGWHLHFRDDDSPAGHLVAVIITVGTALHLVERGMHRLGRCASSACGRVWADFSRPGTQRYCSPRCANTDAVRCHRAHALLDTELRSVVRVARSGGE